MTRRYYFLSKNVRQRIWLFLNMWPSCIIVTSAQTQELVWNLLLVLPLSGYVSSATHSAFLVNDVPWSQSPFENWKFKDKIHICQKSSKSLKYITPLILTPANLKEMNWPIPPILSYPNITTYTPNVYFAVKQMEV